MPEQYDPPITPAKRNDLNDPIVVEARRLMSESQVLYVNEQQRREWMIELAEETAFEITDPSQTTRRIENQLMYIARQKTEQQLRVHDWSLECPQASENERAMVQAAFEEALDQGGFEETFKEGNSIFLGTGDEFTSFGANQEWVENRTGFPFNYRNESIIHLFFPTSATRINSPGFAREARRMVRIWEGQWDTALKIYPWMKDGQPGRIPEFQDNKNLDFKTNLQYGIENDARVTQVAEFIDLDRKISLFFGGGAGTKGPLAENDNFPYMDRFGITRFPISHRFCIRTRKGILNKGLFHALYKVSILDRILKNIGYGYEIQNLNGITVIPIDKGMSEAEMKQKHTEALDAQANLQQGVIFAKGDIGQVTNLRARDNIIQELQQALELLERDVSRWGININDVFTDPAKTLGALELETEAQTTFARFLQAQNVGAIQERIEMAQDWIIQHIDDDVDIPLVVKAKVRNARGELVEKQGVEVETEFGEKKTVNFTLGDLAQAFRRKDWKVVVHNNNAVVNPRVFERRLNARLANQLIGVGAVEAALEVIEADASIDGRSLNLPQMRQAATAAQQAGGRPVPVEEEERI